MMEYLVIVKEHFKVKAEGESQALELVLTGRVVRDWQEIDVIDKELLKDVKLQ